MPFVPKGQKTNPTYKKIFLPQEINFDSNNEAIFKQQLQVFSEEVFIVFSVNNVTQVQSVLYTNGINKELLVKAAK